jgi:hypothetical protein
MRLDIRDRLLRNCHSYSIKHSSMKVSGVSTFVGSNVPIVPKLRANI